METPIPDEKKVRIDPHTGEVEPAPIDMEGARILADEARQDLEAKLPVDDDDVRRLAEEFVTERGTDDVEDFKRYAEERAGGAHRA
jgi:hypothetical protein